MKIRNYCIAVVDNITGVKEEIAKIAESSVKFVNGKGLMIATFSTVASPSELREYFISCNRSFMLFELEKDSQAVHFSREAIQKHLFSDVDGYLSNAKKPTKKRGQSIKTVTATTTTQIIKSSSVIDIDSIYNIDEIKSKIDILLDKGLENLSESEKKILSKLSKKIKKS